MPRIISVNLVIVTVLPEKGKVAILERIGSYEPLSQADAVFPGGCRVTCHSEFGGNNPVHNCLIWSAMATFGRHMEDFFGNIIHHTEYKKLADKTSGETETICFGLKLNRSFLPQTLLRPNSGGLVFATEEMMKTVHDLSQVNPIIGVPNSGIIAMFLQEAEMVRKALQVLC